MSYWGVLFFLINGIAHAGLGDLAARHGKYFGAFAEYPLVTQDATFRTVFEREFNLATVGVYWYQTHNKEGLLDLTEPRAVADYAVAAGKKLRVHPLVWFADYDQIPAWIQKYDGQPDRLREFLKEHVQSVVRFFQENYPGQVVAFDVVNEPLEYLGTRVRKSLWSQITPGDPEGYIALAFQWAREADPDARLFLNEIFTERNDAKFQALLGLVRRLKARGAPIDGVGIQGHAFAPLASRFGFQGRGPLMVAAAPVERFASHLRQVAKLGVEIHVTEMDVPLLDNHALLPGRAAVRTARRQGRQAEVYEGFTRACILEPACKAMVVWGVSDRDSWIPKYFPGFGRALLFDGQFRPKPAYWGVFRALQ
ncbi:endo-1,4-beta-xylanase [bacterium]|nr:endo-1,4-beta-xylanase [bacterium]